MAQLPTVEDVARARGRLAADGLERAQLARDRAARARASESRPPSRELGYRPHAAARRLRTRQSVDHRHPARPACRTASPAPMLDRFLHALTEQADAPRHAHHALHRERPRRRDRAVPARCATAPTSTPSCSPPPRYDDPRIDWLGARAHPVRHVRPPVGRRTHRRPRPPLGRRRRARGHPRWRPSTSSAAGCAASASSAGRPARAPATTAARGWERRDDASAFGSSAPSSPRSPPRPRRACRTRARSPSSALVARRAPTSRRSSARATRSRSARMMAVREAGRPQFPVIGFDNTPVAQAVGLSSVDQHLGEVAAGTLELLMGATGRRVLPHGSGAADPTATASSPPSLSCAGRVTWRPSRKPVAPRPAITIERTDQ